MLLADSSKDGIGTQGLVRTELDVKELCRALAERRQDGDAEADRPATVSPLARNLVSFYKENGQPRTQ